jgi:hypothetical protein
VPRAGAGRTTSAGARPGDDWAQAEIVSPPLGANRRYVRGRAAWQMVQAHFGIAPES